jgi:polar amino acid transport system permease protein
MKGQETGSKGKLVPIEWGKVPWWIIIVVVVFLLVVNSVRQAPSYLDTLQFLSGYTLWVSRGAVVGIILTIVITVVSYAITLVIGLITGLCRVSKNPILFTVSTLYVEVARGIPMLVLLLYVSFVGVPMVIGWGNSLGEAISGWTWAPWLQGFAQALKDYNIRNVNEIVRGVIGLAIGYGAFSSEIFRAGIQSIEKGQMEAARSLGMSYMQAMRHVILPQAIRRILPPLGNDFIAMLKDSSLISALSVQELTMLGRQNVARTFRTFETWNMVALLYLSMTILLSFGVRHIERKMELEKR